MYQVTLKHVHPLLCLNYECIRIIVFGNPIYFTNSDFSKIKCIFIVSTFLFYCYVDICLFKVFILKKIDFPRTVNSTNFFVIRRLNLTQSLDKLKFTTNVNNQSIAKKENIIFFCIPDLLSECNFDFDFLSSEIRKRPRRFTNVTILSRYILRGY